METRKTKVTYMYNGAAMSAEMSGYITSMTYTDPASGESDAIEISIHDRDGKWLNGWKMQDGDTMQASIEVENWTSEGDTKSFDCGYFLLDDFGFSGWPTTGTISGISAVVDNPFQVTEVSKVWEEVTVQGVAQEIADQAGLTLFWDVDEDFAIASLEQSEETNCAFLMALCETYGYQMKVYAQKIIIYDREAYKQKDSVKDIDKTDILSWSGGKKTEGTYTGGEYTYTDPITETEIVATTGDDTRLLQLSGKADDIADAERKLNAAILTANHSTTTLSITVMGSADIVASQCVTVAGLGWISGKYYIDKITHNVGGGYTMDLELSKVE